MVFTLIVTLCLVASVNAATFDYNFARYKIFPLAAAAYSDDSMECLFNTFIDEEISSYWNWHEVCDDSGNICHGFGAVLEGQKAIVISFRGTDEPKQLWKQLTSRRKMNIWFFGGLVSEYFSSAFWSVWDGHLDEQFNISYSRHLDYEIWITGHSLGGAMASLAAHYIKNVYQIPENKIKLITFGQPRTGNVVYADAFNAQMDYAFRVVNGRDCVPHIPFDDFYYHHKNEIWFPDGMDPDSKYVMCTTKAESDKYCSNSLHLPISPLIRHTFYFGKQVMFWGRDGCV